MANNDQQWPTMTNNDQQTINNNDQQWPTMTLVSRASLLVVVVGCLFVVCLFVVCSCLLLVVCLFVCWLFVSRAWLLVVCRVSVRSCRSFIHLFCSFVCALMCFFAFGLFAVGCLLVVIIAVGCLFVRCMFSFDTKLVRNCFFVCCVLQHDQLH